MLTCSVTGSYPEVQVEWLKDSVLVVDADDERISIEDGESQLIEDTQLNDITSTLSIDNVVISDTGVYTCRTLPVPMEDPILPSVMDSLSIDVTSMP